MLSILGKKPKKANEKDFLGLTPLMHAVLGKKPEIMKILLDHGARVDESSAYGSALHLAVQQNFSEGADLLLERGAPVNQEMEYSERTPLMVAAQENRPEILRRLLKAGADPALKDRNEMTALDIAVQDQSEESIKILRDQTEKSSEAGSVSEDEIRDRAPEKNTGGEKENKPETKQESDVVPASPRPESGTAEGTPAPAKEKD